MTRRMFVVSQRPVNIGVVRLEFFPPLLVVVESLTPRTHVCAVIIKVTESRLVRK